jgi:hypothetical protein
VIRIIVLYYNFLVVKYIPQLKIFLHEQRSLKTDKGKLLVRVGRKAMGHKSGDRQATEVFITVVSPSKIPLKQIFTISIELIYSRNIGDSKNFTPIKV